MEHEGVVVKQGENRIKVKNAAYVAYNRVRETLGASERNVMELILSEKDDDVVPFLPEEIVKNLVKLKAGVQVAIKQHDDNYQVALAEANKILPGDKKTFAILVTKNKELWSSPFFSMFDGKADNMKDFIQKNRKDGTWANGFLDKFLDLAKRASA
jgi:preprotein translocase subunit SecD